MVLIEVDSGVPHSLLEIPNTERRAPRPLVQVVSLREARLCATPSKATLKKGRLPLVTMNYMENNTSCPVTFTASIVSNKWKPVIIDRLMRGPKRFSELKNSVPGISAKVLSQNLLRLERDGIVRRRLVVSRPYYAVYELTEKGRSLEPILSAMERWGQRWLAEPDELQILKQESSDLQ